MHAEDSAAPVAVETRPSVAESDLPVIPPDPAEQVDFELSALSFGPCRPIDADHEEPFVVGHGVEGWSEGEPLWVMTNAGGAVRAAAGKRFEYCGWGILKSSEMTGSADIEETCVPAWTLVTAAPVRCEEPLRNSLPERLVERPGPEPNLLFAVHRRHRPPTLVPMSFEVRVHAVCQDPDKDFDEPGAKIPVEDAAAPIDRRFAQQVSQFDRQHWRAIRVSSTGASEPPLHVVHTAEARNMVKRSQWFVFREHADGSVTSLVAKADRVWHDSPMARERHCGLPYIVPFPVLSFMHAGKLHWVTGMESEKIEARVWEVGDERLRHVHTLPVALYAPKG
ncbi:hypothetical protein [Nannocystis punicea]|uniref:Uncharacterized protein n=1 Tax=Nannocystis punicea TaxID=2995304 RepID=A0ABY7H780_9BACT|nr:hypothetical protein [Nannocystis poenicansa]WAS94869.1 hypothetical protein O0S08_01800 [Nannocystis poenicansa]